MPNKATPVGSKRSKRVAGKPFQRGKIWYARINGVPLSLGTDDEEAAKAAVSEKNKAAFLVRELGVDQKHVTKWEWAQAVLKRKDDMHGVKDWPNQERILRFWWPYFGHVKDLNSITKDVVDQIVRAEFGGIGDQRHVVVEGVQIPLGFKDRDLKPGHKTSGNRTANVYIQAVQTIFNKASGNRPGSTNGKGRPDWDWGVRPYKYITYPEPGARKLALKPVEVWTALEALRGPRMYHSFDIALMAISTMWRRGMVTGLKWEWIDFAERAVSFPETDDWGKELLKNGEDLTVPFNDMAWGIILRRSIDTQRHPVYVFHHQGEAPITAVVTNAWHDRMEAAGFSGKRKVLMHTLRHTGASWLIGRGINPICVNWLGGWKLTGEWGAMENYLHAMVGMLRPFAKLLDRVLCEGRMEFEAMHGRTLHAVNAPVEKADVELETAMERSVSILSHAGISLTAENAVSV